MFSDSLVSWRLSFLAAPLASFMFRSRVSLHLEIIALRHQLAVVNRSRRPCLRLTPVDRMLWAWLSRSWCGWRSGIHRQAGNRPCVASARLSRVLDLESRHRSGRPVVSPDVRALIREMSTGKPTHLTASPSRVRRTLF
jgi:putative transposase